MRVKKIMGRKRQALVDTAGRALTIKVQPARVQDRDGAAVILWDRKTVSSSSSVRSPMQAMPVKRSRRPAGSSSRSCKAPGRIGFVVQPRRRVVERFFGWITRNRRLYRDVEARIAPAQAFLYAASAMILVRRLEQIPIRWTHPIG